MASDYFKVTSPVTVRLGNGDSHTYAVNDLVDPSSEFYPALAAIPNMLVDSGTPLPTPGPNTPPPSVKHLLVYSGANAPSSPVIDDVWYDPVAKMLKRWNGAGWDSAGSAAYLSVVETRARNGQFTSVSLDPDNAVAIRPSSTLSIPTGIGDANNNIVEPDVLFFPDGKFGWEYWLVAAPYLNSDDTYENPTLWVSHDGTTWQAAPGAPAPLFAANNGGGGHNSDPSITEAHDGSLAIYWNQFGPGTQWWVNVSTSTDGVNWTAQQQAISIADRSVIRPMTPCVIYDPFLGLYVMYAIDLVPNARALLRYTSPTPTGPWTQSTSPTYTWPLTGRSPWHLNAYLIGNQHVLLVSDTPNGGSGPGYLFLGVSNDRGASFNFGNRALLDPPAISGAWDEAGYYRSAMLPVQSGAGVEMDLFVGGASAANARWSIGRSRIRFARQRHGNAITAKVTTGAAYYYTHPLSGAPTTTAWANGDLRMGKALFDRTVTLTEMGVEVTATGDAAATYRFAIYEDDGSGKPGRLFADVGSTAAITTTGYKSVSCSITLPAGQYWIGACAQNVTTTAPTVRSSVLNGDPCVGARTATLLTQNANGGWRVPSVTGAPPAAVSLNSANELTTNVPRVIWLVS